MLRRATSKRDRRFRSRPIHTVMAVVVSILCVVVEVQLYRSYADSNSATAEFRRATDATTALANVQRETFLIHTAVAELEEGDGLKRVRVRRALLERQLNVFAGAAGTVGVASDVYGPMLQTLRAFDHQLEHMSRGGRAHAVAAELPGLVRALDRFELQIKQLFDDAERLLYDALTATLHEHGGRQRMIVLVGAIGLLILGAAAFFIRRSIRSDFARAYNALEGEVRERTALQHQLSHQAQHDPLTDLANRVLFRSELLGRRPGTWVLYLDLDGFKAVNDSFGHDAGDKLLVEAAVRLRGCVRPQDTVARLGGDEFAVTLSGNYDEAAARQIADRLVAAMSDPFQISGKRVGIGASIGLAAIGPGGSDPDEVLRDADLAMYAAKKEGKGACRVFTPELRAVAVERAQTEDELRSAIENGELELHYQPIVDVVENSAVGFEALMRWRHPQRGLLYPGAFIEVAEDSGLMVPIGRWALEAACREAASWPDAGDAGRWVSVNISPRQLRDPDLADFLRQTLEATGLPPHRLTLEISEMTVVENHGAAARVLAELRQLGVRLAMDDFGAGYSSLGYLRFLAIDVLKIDKCWVDEIVGDSQQTRVAEGIVQLGAQVRVDTIAEGVETREQLDALRAVGCRLMQGFYYSRAVPASDVPNLIRRFTAPFPLAV